RDRNSSWRIETFTRAPSAQPRSSNANGQRKKQRVHERKEDPHPRLIIHRTSVLEKCHFRSRMERDSVRRPGAVGAASEGSLRVHFWRVLGHYTQHFKRNRALADGEACRVSSQSQKK